MLKFILYVKLTDTDWNPIELSTCLREVAIETSKKCLECFKPDIEYKLVAEETVEHVIKFKR